MEKTLESGIPMIFELFWRGRTFGKGKNQEKTVFIYFGKKISFESKKNLKTNEKKFFLIFSTVSENFLNIQILRKLTIDDEIIYICFKIKKKIIRKIIDRQAIT